MPANATASLQSRTSKTAVSKITGTQKQQESGFLLSGKKEEKSRKKVTLCSKSKIMLHKMKILRNIQKNGKRKNTGLKDYNS